jgi:hypothetical protein
MRQAVAQKAGLDGSNVSGPLRRVSIRDCSLADARGNVAFRSTITRLAELQWLRPKGEATMRQTSLHRVLDPCRNVR